MTQKLQSAVEASAFAAVPGAPGPIGPLGSQVAALLDPWIQPFFLERYLAAAPFPEPGPDDQVVLVGHRGAGKSSLLPLVARALGRTAVDLDGELERRSGRSVREWFTSDEPGFRAAERDVFTQLPRGQAVSVGGGFLSLHADLLERTLPVLVPASFRALRERLLSDTGRPRLHPELSLEEEIRTVWRARELKHRTVRTVPLADLVAAVDRAGARR